MKNLDLIKKLLELPVDADVSFLVSDESGKSAPQVLNVEGVFPSTKSDVLLASDEDDLIRFVCNTHLKEVLKKRDKFLEDYPPGERTPLRVAHLRWGSFNT